VKAGALRSEMTRCPIQGTRHTFPGNSEACITEFSVLTADHIVLVCSLGWDNSSFAEDTTGAQAMTIRGPLS
jgi:hypothetical protein